MKRRSSVFMVALVVLAGAGLWASAGASGSITGSGAMFRAGAAVESFTPPPFGAINGDPADCLTAADSQFNGSRQFAFEEPYIDQQHSGHYDPGDPFIDCNHDGRWDGNTPRFYDHVADQVGARALVISNGRKTVAMEVVDNEGLFNIYGDRIRAKVLADGYRIDNIQISSTHDESAPDTIGINGVTPVTSGTNLYFVDYLVQRSALAIEQAYNYMRPANIRYAEAQEPANLRQCMSSYPFIDNQLMPVLQAVGTDGTTIATLASVSQHAETGAFNGGSQLDPGTPYTLDQENRWITADWPYWFRAALESAYGGVGIEMAGSVGSVETPEVWSATFSRTPQQYVAADHPADCRTLWNPPAGATMTPLGYYNETEQLGQQLAGAVESALLSGSSWSQTSAMWARTANICVPVSNVLFAAIAPAGVFAERPLYLPGCRKLERMPVAPTGSTAGTSVLSQVAAWRIGDAEFIGAPGEVFPFTFFRGPVGPEDMNYSQYGMPAWPLPYMHTPFRFFDGLDNDMLGYIFPRGNDAGVPGQHVLKNPTASGTDRFGCPHDDDSEAASDKTADIIGVGLLGILKQHARRPESIEQGRFVLPDGKLSRNPLGTTDTIKCTAPVDITFAADGPAVAVWQPGAGIITPAQWMDLFGRPQTTPDRNTRGYIDAAGHPHWLDVFADIAGQPASVMP